MFYVIVSITGLVFGAATIVLGFLHEARMRRVVERLRAGGLTESEAVRDRAGLLYRFRAFVVVVALVIAGLLVAIPVHAVIMDAWDGDAVLQSVVLAVVLVLSAAWLRRLRARITALRSGAEESS
ncbi:hypothetical protein A6A08_06870 [Nocardiopsis sp. TSRI0078]|uniref:hypothetical protein n=1 Tax=unclassified Nocardiopsis TaxID=2649073 RepID=UPI00093B47EE|nr:hypothetical protein [Nocardiopsis sp. TSRI0078]OKI16985.1 hypothetical protein A6A08_06870 [Nocardiopsis sp. TSRI0078]